MRTKWLWLICLVSVFGVGIGIYETWQFLEVRFGLTAMGGLCQSGAFDCVRVESSPYAAIFGMPLAVFGVGWFLGTLALALTGLADTWKDEVARLLKLLGWGGVFIAATMLSIMVFEVKALCLFCLGTDLCLLLNFALSRKLEISSSPAELTRWKKVTILFVGAMTAALALGFLSLPPVPSTGDFERIAAELEARRTLTVPDRDRPSIGPKDAKVTVVKFSDFQCPACRRGAVALHRVLPEFEGKVRFVFRNFPLDPSCNRLIPRGGHPFACEVARVSLCAWRFGKFKEFYETIFNRQSEIAAGFASRLAVELGVPKADLDACVADPLVTAMISQDIDDGEKLEVMSTPTFFVNGKRFEGGGSPDIWRLLLNRMGR